MKRSKHWGWTVAVWGMAAGLAYTVLKGKGNVTTPSENVVIKESKELSDTDRLMSIAKRELNLSEGELTVRGLIPLDLGLNTFDFALNPGWNTVVSTSCANGRFIMFTGLSYYSANPVATEVKLNLGSSASEVYGIQQVAYLENHTFTDTSPSIARQNYPIQIQVYASAASASEPIIFSGVVVERRGMTIS